MISSKQAMEIAELTRAPGRVRQWTRKYSAGSERGKAWVHKLVRRPGEVILVVPRPRRRFLVHTKTTYPRGVYRLPGGGLEQGEGLLSAAQREAFEEMGFRLPALRLIGVVDNVFRVDDKEYEYPSFVFLAPLMKQKPRVNDPDEAIGGFREESLSDLAKVADTLRRLPKDWQPWGRFRAAAHQLAVKVLSDSRKALLDE